VRAIIFFVNFRSFDLVRRNDSVLFALIARFNKGGFEELRLGGMQLVIIAAFVIEKRILFGSEVGWLGG
jgi:hypothetical protein